MKLSLVYIYPANDGPRHTDYALRFVCTYHEYPPMVEHDTIVVLNGARTNGVCRCMFSTLPNVTFCEHDDSGWDIGGYQVASEQYPADLMVFFGGSSFFNRPGWMNRVVASFAKYGNGLYGAMGNRGDPGAKVEPHIRTTCFWCPSALMNSYPKRIRRQEDRYEFEHGASCFTNWVKAKNLPVLMVTWSGEYRWKDWDDIRNGYHRGDQSDLIMHDRLSDYPFWPPKRNGR